MPQANSNDIPIYQQGAYESPQTSYDPLPRQEQTFQPRRWLTQLRLPEQKVLLFIGTIAALALVPPLIFYAVALIATILNFLIVNFSIPAVIFIILGIIVQALDHQGR